MAISDLTVITIGNANLILVYIKFYINSDVTFIEFYF